MQYLKMRSLFVAALLTFTFVFQSYAQNQGDDDRSRDPAFEEILREASEDPVLAYFLQELHLQYIRIGIDKVVNEALDNNQVAQELRPQVYGEILDYIDEEDRSHNASTSMLIATPNSADSQLSWLAKEWEDVLRTIGFSDTEIEEARLYYSSRDVMNAYTYSGARAYPRSVYFSKLVKHFRKFGKAGDKALRAVMVHEAGHIFKRDIETRLLLITVFLARGIDLIPERPEDTLPPIKAAEIAKLKGWLMNFVQSLTHRDRASANGQTKLSDEQASRVVERILDRARNVASSVSKSQLESVGDDLIAGLSSSGLNLGISMNEWREGLRAVRSLESRIANPSAGADEEAEELPTFKDLMKFLEKLDGVVSNAIEAGADRVVMAMDPSITAEEAAFADLLLARPDLEADPKDKDGYKTLRAALKIQLGHQAAGVEQSFADPRFSQLRHTLGGTGSHPDLRTRMRTYETMDRLFKKQRSSTKLLMMLYREVSKAITKRYQILENGDVPAVSQALVQVEEARLKAFAEKLGGVLVDIVMKDLEDTRLDAAERFQTFTMILDELSPDIERAKRILEREGSSSSTEKAFAQKWLQKLGSSALVLGKLKERIAKLKDSVLPKNVRDELIKRLEEPLKGYSDTATQTLVDLLNGECQKATGTKS